MVSTPLFYQLLLVALVLICLGHRAALAVPHWVWTAIDPENKLLLTVNVGDRTLAMVQGLAHQVAQMLAPDCVPLFLTDGFREYLTPCSRG